MTMGEKIYTLRTRAGFSQEEFAETIGVSRQSVSKWETAVVIPDTEYIIKICKTLHVSADMLIMDEEISDSVLESLQQQNSSETQQDVSQQLPQNTAEQEIIQNYLASVRCKRNKILTIIGFVLSFLIGIVGMILCSIVIRSERRLPRTNHMSIWGLSISCVKTYTALVAIAILFVNGL